MKGIQERFAADPQRMRAEQAKLFQREKVNPLAGCLPLIPTMFVFYSLFQVLNVSIEMRHTPFIGWIRDMSAADPTTIFNLFGLIPWDPRTIPLIGGMLGIGFWPILYGLTMFGLQSLSAPPTDPMQRQIMSWIPLVFLFLFAGFASGLVIYYVWSNLISIDPAVHHHAPHRRRDRVRQVDQEALRRERRRRRSSRTHAYGPRVMTDFTEDQIEAARKFFGRPVAFVKGAVSIETLPPGDRPEIAFAGRSNVGKSSLINALCNRKNLARASNTPGRTQEINFFDLAEGKFYLVDLPGYGFAEAPKKNVDVWGRLNLDYLRSRSKLRRVFMLIDARRGVGDVDLSVMKQLDSAAAQYQVVLTKLDKIKKSEVRR